ncbi:MAG: hypothetical protein EOP42_04405 [Sphingobacteriaceae bacterium]|nr:MAG: hypothetical protein EOP42_04405 [Sphingobacteriaceae bacterium]
MFWYKRSIKAKTVIPNLFRNLTLKVKIFDRFVRCRNKFGIAKPVILFGGICAGLNLASCKPDIRQNETSYFNLNSYFNAEAKKLKEANFEVIKTVSRNGETETKKLKIENWPQELSLFSESDINKPSWKNSYKTTTSGDVTIYKALEPDLKTQEIIIKKHNQQIIYLMIFNVANNKLFQSKEKLTYYPDSLYIIRRKQHVRFLGTNDYLIEGKMK